MTAATTYYFEIVSGGTTYDNGGTPYEVMTGPVLRRLPEIIWGRAYLADGATPADGAIVYASVGSSQMLSALVDTNGTWALNVASLRTADLQSDYPYVSNDSISLQVQGGADGTATRTVTVGVAKSGVPDMSVFVASVEILLVDGWNLIALPVEPATSYTASTMAADINAQGGNVTQVFWWNAWAGSWDFYLVTSQYGIDFSIELGEGYLLKNSTAAVWAIPGS